jgi:hypothetical protein
MGKLHEVLAVEGDLAGTAKKISEEAIKTFNSRADHFIGRTQVDTYFADEDQNLNKTDSKAMDETVFGKLKYVAPIVSRYWDAYFVKEATNQIASADIVLPDGKVFSTKVPSTVLLGMETKLKELRAIYEHIPTLQPGIAWEKAPDLGVGVYQMKEGVTTFITKRTIRPIEMSPATKEHRAQVDKIEEDRPVARRVSMATSGMLSPAQKSDLLERVDILIRSVKKARQRANNQETVAENEFGSRFFAFIHEGIVE